MVLNSDTVRRNINAAGALASCRSVDVPMKARVKVLVIVINMRMGIKKRSIMIPRPTKSFAGPS